MEREYSLRPPSPPQAPEEPITPSEASVPLNPDLPPAEVKAFPHAADYFNVPNDLFQKAMLTPALDVHGIREKVLFIEKFCAEKIAAMGIRDEKASYNLILEEIESLIGMTGAHESRARIERLWAYLKTTQKMQKTAAKKRDIIASLNEKFAGRRNE